MDRSSDLMPSDRTVFQNAWVVDDVERSARRWVETLGIGPFYLAEFSPKILVDTRYRGRPTELRMLVGLAQAGPSQIELIQPLMDGPSCYRDTVPPGTEGFHHVCVWTEDLDADMAYYEERDCPVATYGQVKGGPRFCYVDAQAELNCMIEILERHPIIEERFRMIADAAQDWDGADPVRRG